MARTDVHRPTELDPTAYSYEGAFDANPDEPAVPGSPESAHVANLRRKLSVRGIGGNWNERGRCDHCGVSIRYVVVFQHTGGAYLAVGEQCAAERFELPTKAEWDVKRLRSVAAESRQSIKRREQIKAFFVENPDLHECMTYPLPEGNHHIVDDMARQLKKKGSLSEKQVALARKLIVQQAEWDAKRAAEKADAKPVPEGTQVVEGVLVATKWAAGYGLYSDDVLKMVVKDDRGFKVFGTVPTSLFDHAPDEMKGQRLRFTASLEQSKDDETFGFFKRPRLAEWLTTEEAS